MLEILLRNKTDAHHYFETVYKLDYFRTIAICTWSLGKQWLNRMNDNLGTIDITYNGCLIDTITINQRNKIPEEDFEQLYTMVKSNQAIGFTTFHHFVVGKSPMIYFMDLVDVIPSHFQFRTIYQTEYSRTRSSDRIYADIQSIIQEATNR